MSDTAYPNFLVVNADGTISAALSGSLRLPAEFTVGDGDVAPDHAVTWYGPTNAVLGKVAVSYNSVDAAVQQKAYSPDQAGSAGLVAHAAASGFPSSVSAFANAKSAWIIESDGSSSFVQARSAACTLALDGGSATAVFANNSPVVTVAHQLGRTPVAAVATPLIGGPLVFNIEIAVIAWNTSAISFQCTPYPGVGAASGNFNFSWLAIG